MSNGNGHHWSKFCWRDWSSDKALHPCSLAAKGFWMEMLCIMHEGSPVGHLTLNGKPATIRQMAANACCTEKEAVKYLAELEEAGVFSRTEDGTIYCRRMVKDAEASETARAWGKTGGNPKLKRGAANGTDNPQRGVNPPLNPGLKPPLKLESESESEREKEKKESKNNVLSFPVLARGGAVGETPPDPDPVPEPASNGLKFATENIVGKLARKLESAGKEPLGKPPKRSIPEQQTYVLTGELPEPEPLRRGPVDPVRTVAEQLAFLGFPNGFPGLAEARI